MRFPIIAISSAWLCLKSPLILTRLQPGVTLAGQEENRFNGFLRFARKTVETVSQS
jgi:hypothetical protein